MTNISFNVMRFGKMYIYNTKGHSNEMKGMIKVAGQKFWM